MCTAAGSRWWRRWLGLWDCRRLSRGDHEVPVATRRRVSACRPANFMIAADGGSERGAALPGAQVGDVVGGGAGGLRGVGDAAQVPGRRETALEGVQHVDVGDLVAGQRV